MTEKPSPETRPAPVNLPSGAAALAHHHPEIWGAFTSLGKACRESGPLEGETLRLVKLAMAVSEQSEGAVHSHVRRALQEGIAPEALRHVALLAIPTIGLSGAVAAMTWIEDILGQN